jgi:hypothetical protein
MSLGVMVGLAFAGTAIAAGAIYLLRRPEKPITLTEFKARLKKIL